jgi:site-specific recombinase XerD
MAQLAVGPTGAALSAEPEQLTLFGGGVDLRSLRLERAALAAARRSPATVRAYRSDLADFSAWCDAAGKSALPASADTLTCYLISQARLGRLPSTLARRVTAIREGHTSAGLASPVTADVLEVLAGLRRRLGVAPRRAKAAVSVAELRAMLAALDGLPPALAARDRALLLVGFASGLRRSELAALDLADVSIVRQGVVLRVRRSKTDQSGKGREVGVHKGRRPATCPRYALDRWIVERGSWPGALFCHVGPVGRVDHARIAGQSVAAAVKAAARRAGLDPARYGGHSLRAGLATAAAELGRDGLAIIGRTGHTTAAMVERYVRHGSLFAVDLLAGAL